MNFLKKTVVCACIGAMAAMGSAAYAAQFSDMPGGAMGLAIENAVNNGLIGGYEDGTVKPNDPITRAQMATIITRAFGTVDNEKTSFNDVSDTAWYKDAVEKAVYMGAFKGDDNGNFNPEKNITFQETYTVLARVFQYEPRNVKMSDGTTRVVPEVDTSCLSKFADASSVADWAKGYAQALVDRGGYTGIDGALKGTDNISRGQFAMIMDELVSLYIDEPGTYTTGFGDGAVIIRCGGVTIDGIKTDKNVIIGYGADTKTTLKNIESGGSIVVMGGRDRTPVEVKKENGETILRADETLVGIQGFLHDIRVMSPCTTVSVGWTNPNPSTSVFIIAYDPTALIDLGFIQ